ncbi:hypothetical protein F7098_22055 [Dickeya dianthicola]|nr:hypothetical protein [Dickeya dianthicola]MBI0481691.1 hypothetical protein [Dickeya dianthicola]MBI0500555.1 hypothetical protein [Dickeya dianthicola]MBI0504836.1 hypothetical protein [Dickeya dianthicola]MBI0525185.1 hypothetical protein [Dickeya dianthicola]
MYITPRCEFVCCYQAVPVLFFCATICSKSIYSKSIYSKKYLFQKIFVAPLAQTQKPVFCVVGLAPAYTHSPIHPFTHSPIHPFTHSAIQPNR